MTCEELSERYEAFAIGALDSAESAELREHLERQCPNCTPGVRRPMVTVTALSGGVDVKDPPKRLRRRVIALVNPRALDSKGWLLPWSVAGILAIALLSIAIPARRQASETARLEDALTILNDPTTKDVTFGTTEKPTRGRVFVSPTRGVVFIAANLPKPKAGRVIELWTIPASGKPVPQGTFLPQLDASVVYVRQGPIAETPTAIALSDEPEGGSAQPTTTPFLIQKVATP